MTVALDEWDEIAFAHNIDKWWAELCHLHRERGTAPDVTFDEFVAHSRIGWEQERRGVTDGTPDDDGPRILHTWTTRELLAADTTFTWRVRGMLADPTYGQMTGEKKTLKSYVATFLDLAVASGVPLFGHFKVDTPAPVVAYVGEGGRIPYTRRLRRIAAAMGVELDNVPMLTSFETAGIGGPVFTATVLTHLDQHHPGLMHIDPLYAFHPTDRNASNLFESGAMLASLSAPCVDAGACLLINNHWNKTGSGRGLDRITQSGSAEWSDTWILLSHREPPDVANGRFRLLMEIGSRQWGGTEWDLDLDIGRFDPDLGEFDGAITWDLRRHDPSAHSDESRVVEIVGNEPFQHTREQLAKRAGGNVERLRQVIDNADRKGLIAVKLVIRNRSNGRPDKAWVYGPVEPTSDDRTQVDAGWDGA
jgi:hypothetical protein